MSLNETVTSGKMCKMTNISLRTLMWWVENGLIEYEKNQNNGYHLFNLYSLHDVCEIKFLQKAGLNLNQIKNREKYEMDFLYNLYKTKHDDLTEQIKALINAQKIVQKQIKILDRIKKEENTEITMEEPPFNYIEQLSINDEKLINIRINHNCNDITYASKKTDVFVGISSDEQLTEKPVWKKSNNSRFFKLIAKEHNELMYESQKPLNEEGEQISNNIKKKYNTIYTKNFLPLSIIKNAPNQNVHDELLKDGITVLETKNLMEVMDNLTMLGYDIKSLIFVWLLNAYENGVGYKYFDVYLEY